MHARSARRGRTERRRTPNSPGSDPLGNSRVTCPIFRPGPRFGLAVEMRDQPRRRQDRRPQSAASSGPTRFFITASEWRDGGRQRQAGDGADMQFELAGRAGVDRPVAGIVRARGDLVRPAPGHRASTNISTASRPTRSSASATRRAIACACRSTASRDACRRQGEVEDVVAMPVLHRIEGGIGCHPRRARRPR